MDLAISMNGHVAEVMLQRPPHNFVDAVLLDDLAGLLEKLDRKHEVRCIVMASEGRSFCAGADFSRDEGSGETARKFYAAAVRIFAIRKPLIAAVHGPAIGAGMGLALVADFRIIGPDARFAANFVKLGIHPGFGLTHTLPRLVGEQAAAMLLLTGRRIQGEEAVRIGLADILVPSKLVRQSAMDLAQEIAGNAPLAVLATRSTLRRGMADAVARQTQHEVAEQERLFQSEDYAEGLRAVSERRPGRFFGR